MIPFLGAGASLCERPSQSDWRQGYLPSGSELAAFFAENYGYPEQGPLDLVRVSQYVELTAGDATLYEELHSIFAGTYEPNKLHRLLAEFPAIQRARDRPQAGQLVITTNYDDALEQAFAAAGEDVDVVRVRGRGQRAGLVRAHPTGRRARLDPQAHRLPRLRARGAERDPEDPRRRRSGDETADSYVITEDHYIDYLAQENLPKLIPAYLMARMRTSHFLFLGYGMRDWNLRVILRHIWSEQTRHFASWAIQLAPGEIDRRFWDRHGVEIVDAALEEWVDTMRAELG